MKLAYFLVSSAVELRADLSSRVKIIRKGSSDKDRLAARLSFIVPDGGEVAIHRACSAPSQVASFFLPCGGRRHRARWFVFTLCLCSLYIF